MALPVELEATVDRPAKKLTVPTQDKYERLAAELIERRRLDLRAELKQVTDERDALQRQIEAQFGADPLENQINQITKEMDTIDANFKTLEPLMNAASAAIDPDNTTPELQNNIRHQWDRARANLTNKLTEQWGKAAESVATNNVTDGLELYQRYKKGKPDKWDASTIPWTQTQSASGEETAFEFDLPVLNSPDYQAVCRQLDILGDVIDAVSDTVLAESMYHLVKGNPLRAGATLDAIAKGEAPPPQLEVSATPTSGVGVSHRIVSICSGSVLDRPAWPLGTEEVRAHVEPSLHVWLAEFLPEPQKVLCQVLVKNLDSGEIVDRAAVSLNTLKLSSLDVLYCTTNQGPAQRSELEQRLAYYRRYVQTPPPPLRTEIIVSFDRDPAWPPDTLSVGEFWENLRILRQFLASSRPLEPGDLTHPQDDEGRATGIDVQELKNRADQAVTALQGRLVSLKASIEALRTGADISPAVAELLGAAAFGIPACIPDAFTEPVDLRSSLLAQGEVAVKEMERRVSKVVDIESSFAGGNDQTQVAHHIARIKLVFGDAFMVLPRFQVRNPTDLTQTFAYHSQFAGADPTVPLTWLQMVSKVRQGTARFKAACDYSEALGGTASLTLKIGQLPYQEGERWIALPAIPNQPIQGGRLAIVAHVNKDVQFSQPLAGLFVDEWVEVIPNARQVTGITFHYDQPNARAPQSILLAVAPQLKPPDQMTGWDLSTVADIVNGTFELAKIRALAPDQGVEMPWLGDAVRHDGTYGGDEKWDWGPEENAPFSGRLAHVTAALRGLHQHYFHGATDRLLLNKGDALYAYVFIDPASPPSAVMLQWLCDGEAEWLHRAYWGPYWGVDNPSWGVEHTPSRLRWANHIPTPGQWIRLEVPAAALALEGKAINGLAFTLYDGKAKWGHAGKIMRPSLWFPESLELDLSRATRPVGGDSGGH